MLFVSSVKLWSECININTKLFVTANLRVITGGGEECSPIPFYHVHLKAPELIRLLAWQTRACL